MLPVSWPRIAGAVAFAALMAFLVATLSAEVDGSDVLWMLGTGLVIGYVAYPGLAYAFSQRAPLRPTWRRVVGTVAIAGPLAVAVVLGGAWLTGEAVRVYSLIVALLLMGSMIYLSLGHRDPGLKHQ